MTEVGVDNITDAAGTGAPDFLEDIKLGGTAVASANTFQYFSQADEPEEGTIKDGALWWKSDDEITLLFVNDSWKELAAEVVSSVPDWEVDISSLTYDSVSFSVASQDIAPNDIEFNDDGTKLYLLGASNDAVYQYSLSTAYDLSTMSYDSVSFDPTSQDTSVYSLALNNDGTKMFLVGSSTDAVYQYSLSTAYDLSTMSYDSVSFSVASQATVPTGVRFNTDGTKMFVIDFTNSAVYSYTLSTGFDLSTASYDSVSLSITNGGQYLGLQFNPSGTKLYVVGRVDDVTYQYGLSTAFDISTASYDNKSFAYSALPTGLTAGGITFNADGTKLYYVDQNQDAIYQFSTGL